MAEIAIVKYFLENAKIKTDLSIKDHQGRNFLHYAANGAHVNKDKVLDILPLLLELKLDEKIENLVNQADKEGLTPLHLACMKGCTQANTEGRIAVIKALSARGAKQEKDIYGRKPADLAIAYKLDGIAKILAALAEAQCKYKAEVSAGSYCRIM